MKNIQDASQAHCCCNKSDCQPQCERFMNLNNNSSQFIPKQRVPRRISHSVIGLLHGKRKCCEEKGRQSVSNLLIGTETKMIAKKFNQDNPLTGH